MINRIDKINYYLDIAEVALSRGTCIRRNYGAVIVKNDSVVSTGYTGAPRGRKNCCDLGKCQREEMNIERGTRYELCRSVHAEMNAIIKAIPENMAGASLYLVGVENNEDGLYVAGADCCAMCKRMIINAEIETVYIRVDEKIYKQIEVSDWIENDDSLSGVVGY